MTDRIRADIKFAIMPEWVLYHPDLSHAAVRVYGALVRHANSNDEAWPSRASLSRECHCSPSTVKRAISDLLDAGAISREPRFEDGRQTSNLYVVYSVPPTDRGEGVTSDPGEGVTYDPGEGVTSDPGKNESQKERENPLSDESDDEAPFTMSHVEAFEALANACGYDADKIKAVGGGLIGKNAKIIRDLRVTAAEVEARAKAYKRKHPDWDLTPAALVKWWPTLGDDLVREQTCECGQPLNRHDDTVHDVMMETA